ncbi:uncharacterized protein DFL_008696 [Arthrobotrys flagrans]|uniref:Uncharacterized protein n=1 Tax=Arthrobotrys flagrans TaxID=97331 RepID=A0A436ZPI9_ARTFL|nr:hypothetical protein DFL_008696 [Arthrobotrys flagrans]
MKFSILSTATVLLASGLVELATAANCVRYWEGTAPFCDSKCPAKLAGRTCKGTGQFSSTGNGGKCWSGRKQLCECCGGSGPPPEQACLNPRSHKSKCVGLVLICSRIGVKADGTEVVCSTYACGSCFFG